MADDLRFPILFDLEKGVDVAIKDWDGKYASKLEKAIQKRALEVKLKFDTKQLDSLNAVKKRLALLKIEPITPETKTAIKELASELRTLAKALEQVQKYAKAPTKGAVDASRINVNEQRAKAQAALAAQRAAKAEDNLAAARLKAARAANVGASATRNANKAFHEQSSYLQRLTQRMVAYWSVRQVGSFLMNIREVTAEFELQRISLGAIIQDQARANRLFSEIKNFALKSPVKILDLTKYTKQLAAYKIGVNELFDTTKRLTDISIGLGVSMERIVLMFGQIRATGYLRASEVRQATEAGIPLVEELAAKLSEANGTLVTSAQVLKMVEERAISFDMVKEVFEDMTNAGGIFYDMQEKQGNTLYGMWQKLGDAASMMYDEIGNTGAVNTAMKGIISVLRTLMLNWKETGAMLLTVATATAVYIKRQQMATLTTKLATAANTGGLTALRMRIEHLKKAIMYQKLFATSTNAATVSTRLFTFAQLRLTQALNLVVSGLKALKAAFMSNIWGIALVGLSLLIEHLLLAKDTVKELKNELGKISLDYETKQGQDAANLEYLANAAVNAAKGSKAQKDALEELKNTYGKIIPLEMLKIENLERMKGNYGELIALIDEYNLKEKYEKERAAVESAFAPKEEERAGKIRNILREGVELQYGNTSVFNKTLELSERNIQRFLLNLKKYADEGLDKKEQIIRASADLAAELGLNKLDTQILTESMIELDRHELEGQGTLMDYTEALHQKHEAMQEVNKDYEDSKKALNEYSAVVDEVMKKNENEPEVTTNKDEFANEKERLNNQIGDVANGIVELLNKANVAVDDGTQQILNTVIKNGGMIPDAVWDILEKAAEAVNNPKLLDAIQDLRKHYKGLAPDNQTVNFIKDRMAQIVSTAGLKMKEFRQYLWDGQGDIKTYQESLQKSINTLRAQAFEMIKLNALIDAGLAKGQKYDVNEIQTLQAKADALQRLLETSVNPLVMPDDKKSKGGKGGSKSDTRLQSLQEMWKTLKAINKEYDDLAKKEGTTKAGAWITENYAETLDTLNKLAKKFNLKFDFPLTPENLQKYGKQIIDKIKSLKLKGGDKAAVELELELAKDAQARLERQIETQLKQLADRISRTKTAKEFYDKILGMTGDYSLASRVADSIFGENGAELQRELADQVRGMTNGIELPDGIISADNIIDYRALREFAEANKTELGKMYDQLIKIANDGQKDLAKTYEGYLKDLEVAKTYADKRVELARTTAARIAEIERNPQYTQEQKTQLKRGYQEREGREAAKLEYEAFKNTPLYVQMFENLEQASSSTLEMMKSRLEALSRVWGTALDPTQLKEIQSRMEEIDRQLRERNPFKTLKKSYQDYQNALSEILTGTAKKAGEAAGAYMDATVAYGSESPQAKAAKEELEAREKIAKIARQISAENLKGAKALDRAAQIANDELQIKQTALDVASQEEIDLRKKSTYKNPDDDPDVIAAHERVEAAIEEMNVAERVAEITTNSAHTAKKLKESFIAAGNQLSSFMGMAGDLAHAVADTIEALGADEEDVQFWNDIGTAIEDLTSGFQGLVDAVASTNVAGAISSAIGIIPNMVKGFVGLFSAGKVRKANKEIKKQQKLLEQLEYSYSRLEKAAEKTLGNDYIDNYNRQMGLLQAQQTAYLKQAEAERSKGKKADKDKIKDYENQARETADKIADMQGQIAEQLTGTDVTAAAKDFASAWLDARLSFESTTDAIKEKFDDMVKNLVVNQVMAKIVQTALQPLFDSINDAAKDGLSTQEIAATVSAIPKYIDDINNGLEVGYKSLQSAGVDFNTLREKSSDLSGIAKGVGSASSEEINANTAALNTQNYYVSHIPTISVNVAEIAAMLRGNTGAATGGTPQGWTDWQQQAMANYTAIQRNTADTVVECRRAANACEEAVAKLGRVISPKGAQTTYGVNVFLRQ